MLETLSDLGKIQPIFDEKGKIVEFYHYEDSYTVYTHEIGYGDICVFLFLHTHSMSETNSRV